MAKKNTKLKLIGLVSNLINHRTYYTTKAHQNRTTKGQVNSLPRTTQLGSNTQLTPRLRRTRRNDKARKSLGNLTGYTETSH